MQYTITGRYNHKGELITDKAAPLVLDCRAARDAIARLNAKAQHEPTDKNKTRRELT